MSKKVYNLVVLISGAVTTVASGLLAFFAVPHVTAFVGLCGVINTAVVEGCACFLET